MIITTQDITHIALLARLAVSDEEKALYATQLSTIFDYIHLLDEVDTTDVPETISISENIDVVREDVLMPSDARAGIINQFPKKVGALLQVSAVFDTES